MINLVLSIENILRTLKASGQKGITCTSIYDHSILFNLRLVYENSSRAYDEQRESSRSDSKNNIRL